MVSWPPCSGATVLGTVVPGHTPGLPPMCPSVWLQVLEACMKNCGRRLHNEVGKFRFLNELIKVVSPKVSQQRFPHL